MLVSTAAEQDYLGGGNVGTIKCKTCRGTWTVSTAKTGKVVVNNHNYLNPGHRIVTVWKKGEEVARAS